MALLPYTEWGDDRAMNAEKRKELSMGFAYQLERKEMLFKNYISAINTPKTTLVGDWND